MTKKLFLAMGMLAIVATPTIAEEVKLPKTLVWTSFDVGSTTYNQSVAIGKALQDAYGVALRVLPTSTDQSRLAPARDGRVPFAATGSDSFYAMEGVNGYARPEWGPQALSAVSFAGAENCAAFGTAADANIKTAADARGKRIGKVIGSPSLQANIRAFLAFGGLTEDDVELVELPGYAAAWKALANGQIDGMTGLTTGGLIERAAASPHGLHWVPLPHDDVEGWKRLNAVNPHFAKSIGTLGANVSKEKPLECAGLPNPILITYDNNKDGELIYNVIKGINLQADNFAAAEPAANGWRADRQVLKWVIPYNENAVRYWKEIGIWSDELQAHNDALQARKGVLATAWKKMDGITKDDDFVAKWMKVRAAELETAGLPVYFN